jgi:uncharacterized membrane protein
MKILTLIRKLHYFLKSHLFYPLLVATGLVFFFFAVRIRLSGGGTFGFLIWNLFLAWLPYWFALGVSFLSRGARPPWVVIVPLGVLWLLFLPNAPYILTDLIHLDERHGVPLWYDAGFILTVAITGMFLGIASLRVMHGIIQQAAGRLAGWVFALGVIALSGLGVYLGRFVRWNSWDLLENPLAVLLDTLRIFRHPIGYADKLGFIFMFTALFSIGYIFLGSVQPLEHLTAAPERPDLSSGFRL